VVSWACVTCAMHVPQHRLRGHFPSDLPSTLDPSLSPCPPLVMQISSYVFDVVRTSVPKMELDHVLESGGDRVTIKVGRCMFLTLAVFMVPNGSPQPRQKLLAFCKYWRCARLKHVRWAPGLAASRV
jgi:hypothetical protein